MKKQVPKDWYFQSIKWFNKGINDELFQVKQRFERFENYPTPFDIKTGYSKDRIFEILSDAVNKLGSAKNRMQVFKSKYEPNEQIKPDWKRIEAYIRSNSAKIDANLNIRGKWDFYMVVSEFFCNAKWAVLDNSRNNERIFRLMYKYCEGY